MGAPPIVKFKTVGRSAHKWPNAPGREGLGWKWGGNLKKCPKCEMSMNFEFFEEGCQKRVNVEMANLQKRPIVKVDMLCTCATPF